jgi:serine/threonine protein kinase
VTATPSTSDVTSPDSTLKGTSSDSDESIWSSGHNTPYGEYHLPSELGVVNLGPLLGTGSFGKVYRASTDSQQSVAVKVIDCRQRDDDALQSQLREVQLSCSLHHPNLVKILSYATSTDMAGGKQIDILWMVQELCELGTLTSAIERGWLRKERTMTAKPDMEVVVATLLDIAKAMEYVHSCKVIHADLTGRNVLLSSSTSRSCGFSIKVCDFGMSRYTHGHALPTKDMGTITHMPPELLRLEDPKLVPEADVWAFGVIGWEAYHGKRCYCGKSVRQVVVAVVCRKPLPWKGPEPEDSDALIPKVVSLMKRCLKYECTGRPAFSVVVEGLKALVG